MERSYPQPVKRRSGIIKQEDVSSLRDEKSMHTENLFSILLSLLPEPPQKEAEESVLVSEVMVYIQKLEKHIQELKKKRADLQISRDNSNAVKKLQTEQVIGNAVMSSLNADGDAMASSDFSCTSTCSLMGSTDQSSQYCDKGVVLHFFDADLFITVTNRKNKSTFLEIVSLMQAYELDVIHASMSTTERNAFYTLHVRVVDGDTFPKEALESALHALTSI